MESHNGAGFSGEPAGPMRSTSPSTTQQLLDSLAKASFSRVNWSWIVALFACTTTIIGTHNHKNTAERRKTKNMQHDYKTKRWEFSWKNVVDSAKFERLSGQTWKVNELSRSRGNVERKLSVAWYVNAEKKHSPKYKKDGAREMSNYADKCMRIDLLLVVQGDKLH